MHPRSIATIFLTSLLLASMLSACSSREEQEEKYLGRAQALYDEGDNERAQLELRNVLQINRENPKAHYLKALIKESENDLRGMVASLRKTVENDPKHVEARIRLAQLLMRYGPGADDQTLALIDEVDLLEPGNPDSHAIRAIVLYRQGETEVAIQEAQKSLARDPSNLSAITLLSTDAPDQALAIINEGIKNRPEDTELRKLKISFLRKEDKPEEVINEFIYLVSQDPENLTFLKEYVRYLGQQGRTADVEQVLQETVSRQPENLAIKIWLVQANVFSGNIQRAQELTEKFISEQPEEMQLQFLLVQIYTATDRHSESEQTLRGIIEQDKNGPDGLRARNLMARAQLREGDRDGAQLVLDDIFAIEPDNTDALITRAGLKISDGETVDAVMDLRTVVKNNPKSGQALLMLGEAHEANESKELALDVYRKALDLEPRNQKAVLKIAELLKVEKDTSALDLLFEQYLTVKPLDLEISRALYGSYVNQSRWSDALGIAARLEQQDENKAQGVYLKGLVLYAQKDYVAANTAFESAITLQPDFAEALSSLIQAKLSQDAQQDALYYLEKHIAQYPEQVNARELQGSLYMRLGNMEAAAESYKSSLVIDPKQVKTHITLARIYQQQEKFTEAYESFDAAIELAPKNPELLILKAGVYESRSRYEKAVETYEAALAIDANQSIAANNLAMLLVDQFASNESYARALEITNGFEKSKVPTFLDTRGWVHFKMGEYDPALPLFKAAAESESSQPVFHYHLGMTYYKLGDKVAAKAELQASLKDNADYYGVETAREVLSGL